MSEGLQSPMASPVRQSVSETEASQRVQPAAHRSADQGSHGDEQPKRDARDRPSSDEVGLAPVLVEDQVVLSEAALKAALLETPAELPASAAKENQEHEKEAVPPPGSPSIHFKV